MSFKKMTKGVVFGRTVLVVGIVLSVVLALVGCGNTTDSQGQEQPVKIGVLLPTSGVYAQVGEDISNGMKIYFEAQGNEIGGRPVQLIVRDSEADPQVGAQEARELIERDEVDLLAGTVSTAVAYAVMDLATREQIPFVDALAVGNDVTRGQPEYIFRTSMSSWQHSYPMGEYMVENGVEDVVVLAADYAAGQEQAAAFMDGFTTSGGNVIDESYPPLSTNDYSSYLTSISTENADGVWTFFAGSDAVRFVQQYDQRMQDMPLYGNGSLVGNDTLPAQGEAAVGVKTLNYYTPTLDTPENQEFVENFENAVDRQPSFYSVGGYDAAWLIGEAIKATDGNTEDIDTLIEAMENVDFESPRGPMTLDENHNPVQNMYMREARKLDDGTIENVVIDTIENVKDPG